MSPVVVWAFRVVVCGEMTFGDAWVEPVSAWWVGVREKLGD